MEEREAPRLLDLLFDAVEAGGPGTPPPDLRSRVVGAALRRRMTPPAAVRRTAAELDAVLGALGPHEWHAPLAGGPRSVRDVVRHLIGIERYQLGALGDGPAFASPQLDDHHAVSMRASGDLDGAPVAELHRAWADAARAARRAASEHDPDRVVVFHGLPMTVATLLVVRSFEIWTHGDDVRRATRRPANDLDGERLELMSSELLRVLPIGMVLRNVACPRRTVQFDLHGPGGASTMVALAAGETPGPPDLRLSLSALDLCRVASNRLDPDDLDMRVEGDAGLVAPVLVGAAAFAVD